MISKHWSQLDIPPVGTEVFLGNGQGGPFTVSGYDPVKGLTFFNRTASWVIYPDVDQSRCYSKHIEFEYTPTQEGDKADDI